MDTRKTHSNTPARIITGILFIIVAILTALSCFGAFSKVGSSVKLFWIGTFGLFGYGLSYAMVIVGFCLVFNIRRKRSVRNLFKHISLFLVAIWALHIYTSSPQFVNNGYGEYLKEVYYCGSTCGGVIFGVPSWLIMKAITPVGALVVVAFIFLLTIFFAYIFPYLRHNISYSSSTKDNSKKHKSEKIDALDSPTITSFGAQNGSQTFAVDVEGSDSRLYDKNATGADGYTPMQANSQNIVNGLINDYSAEAKPQPQYGYGTSQSIAQQILFGNEADMGMVEQYRISKDPSLAMNNVSAPYSAQKKAEFLDRLGWSEERERQEFMDRYRTDPYQDEFFKEDNSAQAAPVQQPQQIQPQPQPVAPKDDKTELPSFFELKAEQEKLFKEMNKPQEETSTTLNDVVQPTHVMEPPKIERPVETTNYSGLQGVVNRALAPEEEPKQEPKQEVESEVYYTPQTPVEVKSQVQQPAQQTVYHPQPENVPHNYFTNDVGNKVLKENAMQQVEQPVQQVVQPVIQPIYQQPIVNQPIYQPIQQEPPKPTAKPIVQGSQMDLNQAPPLTDYEKELKEKEKAEKLRKESLKNKEFNDNVKKLQKVAEDAKKDTAPQQVSIEQVKPVKRKPYVRPPMSLLKPPEPIKDQGEDTEAISQAIVETLDFFSFKAQVIDIKTGPTFTLYTCTVQLPKGKSITSIQGFKDDLAMRLEKESVRILAPIPGKNAIGIEIPNKHRSTVTFSEVVQSDEFKNGSLYAVGVGKDLYGKIHVYPFPKFPHILIAGQTGAGKSCCIGTLLCSVLYKCGPEDCRLILVDPKRTEFTAYNGIPHLLTDEVICDVDKAIRALNWAVNEMMRRMQLLALAGCRDIDEYNAKCEKDGLEKLPRILIVIDELADLMELGKKAVEESINRIGRLARASGIHMVLATQRPSVDVISGTIKNNLPTRMACKVTSLVDSKTILDYMGAESLLGNGDLLFKNQTMSNPARIQGAYISNDEVSDIVNFIKQHNEAYFDEAIKKAIWTEPRTEDDRDTDAAGNGKKDEGGISPDVKLAVEAALENNSEMSISFLQRRLGFGWPRAAKAFDQMKLNGLIEVDPNNNKKWKLTLSEEDARAMINGGNADSGESEE